MDTRHAAFKKRVNPSLSYFTLHQALKSQSGVIDLFVVLIITIVPNDSFLCM